MMNNQIIRNEAAKLAPATLHAIATANHTPAEIEALAAQILVTEEDGTQHPGTVQDAEVMLAAYELHTIHEWNRQGKRVKTGETHLSECYLWMFTTKPSKAQREAAEAEGKEAAEHPHFYPTKAYLFSCLQVEDEKAAPAGRFSSTAEIIAYNKKLAAERKAAKAPAKTATPTKKASKPAAPAKMTAEQLKAKNAQLLAAFKASQAAPKPENEISAPEKSAKSVVIAVEEFHELPQLAKVPEAVKKAAEKKKATKKATKPAPIPTAEPDFAALAASILF